MQQTFKHRLSPFSDLLYDFSARVVKLLEPMTDDELRQLIEDSKKPTFTNCGWGTYRVAPIVRDEAKGILYARKKASAVQ